MPPPPSNRNVNKSIGKIIFVELKEILKNNAFFGASYKYERIKHCKQKVVMYFLCVMILTFLVSLLYLRNDDNDDDDEDDVF